MKKVRGVYLDDDVFMHEVVKDLGKNSPYIEIVRTFASSKEFIENAGEEDYDVYFLDIYMPDINGFEVAKLLKGKHIIFITGEAGALTEAVTFHPVDILMKPINPIGFNIAGKRAVDLINSSKKKKGHAIFNVVGKGRVALKLDDILFVTTDVIDGRNKQFYMQSGEVLTIKKCKLEELQYSCDSLIQINKAQAVSISIIERIEFDTITLKKMFGQGNVKQVTLGKIFAKELRDRLELNQFPPKFLKR